MPLLRRKERDRGPHRTGINRRKDGKGELRCRLRFLQFSEGEYPLRQVRGDHQSWTAGSREGIERTSVV